MLKFEFDQYLNKVHNIAYQVGSFPPFDNIKEDVQRTMANVILAVTYEFTPNLFKYCYEPHLYRCEDNIDLSRHCCILVEEKRIKIKDILTTFKEKKERRKLPKGKGNRIILNKYNHPHHFYTKVNNKASYTQSLVLITCIRSISICV